MVGSVEFDVSEEGASVDAVGASASVDFKTVICAVVGFAGLDYCDKDAPE